MKQSIQTALITVAILFVLNQFEATRTAFNGGNKFFG